MIGEFVNHVKDFYTAEDPVKKFSKIFELSDNLISMYVQMV